MMNIDISDLDKAEVLAALYNNSQPLGIGFLHYDPTPMTKEEAQIQIDQCYNDHLHFDYIKGRIMKVELEGDELYPGAYDRDNGQGAAARALEPLIAVSKDKA